MIAQGCVQGSSGFQNHAVMQRLVSRDKWAAVMARATAQKQRHNIAHDYARRSPIWLCPRGHFQEKRCSRNETLPMIAVTCSYLIVGAPYRVACGCHSMVTFIDC